MTTEPKNDGFEEWAQKHFPEAAYPNISYEQLADAFRDFRKPLEEENERAKKMLAIEDDNRKSLWTALSMIREALEEWVVVKSREYVLPPATNEGEALVEAIQKLTDIMRDDVAEISRLSAEVEELTKNSGIDHQELEARADDILCLTADNKRLREAMEKAMDIVNLSPLPISSQIREALKPTKEG